MRLNRALLFALTLTLITTVPLTTQAAASQPRLIAYYTSWSIYDRQFFVTDIPADKLTHLNYAFAGISDDGEIALLDEWADTQFPYPGDTEDQPLKGNFHQLQLLKQARPHLQTLISVGGWSDSAKFSDVALTPESRAKFAQSVVAFLVKYGFDGVDIDWEYPTGGGDSGNVERPEDKDNFPLLMGALRTALDAQGQTDGHHYLLTMALGADRSAYQPLDWAQLKTSLDWVNVMAYDMAGEWSSVTGFNAPLYDSMLNAPEAASGSTAVQELVVLGMPADKVVLGVPFYGRGWSGVADVEHGLHQPFKSIPDGTWEAGSFDYDDIVANYLPKAERFWDDPAQVPWLYDAASGLMISYDDPQSLANKAQYVRDQGLGGIMIWELSQDTRDHALLNALADTLAPASNK